MRGASFLTVASQLNITSRLSRKRSLDSLCAACIVSRQYASKQRTGEKYASVVPSKPKQASPHLELPSVSKTLKMFELQAEKRLSQHFIVDAQVTGMSWAVCIRPCASRIQHGEWPWHAVPGPRAALFTLLALLQTSWRASWAI
jgi:hypothetical protein